MFSCSASVSVERLRRNNRSPRPICECALAALCGDWQQSARWGYHDSSACELAAFVVTGAP
eukprot:9362599-Alexandrium_andersonii.AAC.1